MSSTSSPRAATSVATSVRTLPGVEARERPLALRLRLVAVDRDRVDVVAAELLDEPVGAGLRAHEDEREPVVVGQQLDERLHLVVGGDRDEVVVDLAGAQLLGQLAFEARREAGVAAGELADLAVERGREEHRLALGGQPATMRSTCGLKPMSSIRSASSRTSTETASSEMQPAVDEILEAARRRDEDVRVARRPRPACAAARRRRRRRRGCRARAPTSSIASVTCDGELARRHEHERRRRCVASGSSRSTIGIAKASVLPEPVGLLASTSPPRSASGITDALDRERRLDPLVGEHGAHGVGDAERAELVSVEAVLSSGRAPSCRRDLVADPVDGRIGTRPHGRAGLPSVPSR